MAARAIHSATYTRYLDRYNLARNLGIGEETLEDMEMHWNNLAISIQGDLQVIENSLNESMQTLREVSRLNVQLPMIATLLSIEANRYTGTDQALGDNAKQLIDIKENLSTLLEGVIRRCQLSLTHISAIGHLY